MGTAVGSQSCHRQGGSAGDNLWYLLQWPPAWGQASITSAHQCLWHMTDLPCHQLWASWDLRCPLGHDGPSSSLRPTWTRGAWGDRLWTCPATSLGPALWYHGSFHQSRASTGPWCPGAGQSCWTAWARPDPYPGAEHSREESGDGNKH